MVEKRSLAAQYLRLAGYIADSLASPGAAPVAPGYGTSDAFYAANGHFSLVKSCNVWVGEGLQAADLPTGIWTPFAFLVLHHLERSAVP